MEAKTKKAPKIILTDRDLLFFRFLFNHKVASVVQIKNYCYPTANIFNVRKRLRRLVDNHYLTEEAAAYADKMFRVFSLTHKGFRALLLVNPLRIYRKQLKSNSIIHDHVLVDIAHYLKQLRGTQYYLTENEIQCINFEKDFELNDYIKINSDAYLRLERGDYLFDIAIEYEHSQKSKEKYIHLAIDYYLSPSIDHVFYFYRNDWVKNAIVELEEEYYPECKPKFLFSKIDAHFYPKKNLSFKNRKGQEMTVSLQK